MRITVLGSGTSHGVPMIGCLCGTCRSRDLRDRRWRSSIYVELDDGARVLVDTGPDLRSQALAFGVTRVDAILYTHSHTDHVTGFPEIRAFNYRQRGSIPCYGDASTIADLQRTFAYAFDPETPVGGGTPDATLIEITGPLVLGGRVFTPIPLLHGERPILGFRVGAFAYLTDCSAIPEASWPLLEGVELVILDALRHRPHPTHFSLSEAIEIVRRLNPRRAWFTHISHDLPHAATCESLPGGMELAYDGLTIDAP